MAFIRIQAIGDLLKRYRAIFNHAWQQRHTLQGPGYTRHEAQFLPAALALQESPVSPAPRIAMWLLIAFAALAILWAAFGKIDIVATAQGKIIPSDRTKTIQPLMPSIVKAIHVTDGQRVKTGDILIELDTAASQADKDRLTHELAAARLQIERARGMLSAINTRQIPTLPRPYGATEGLWQDTQRQLNGQYHEYTTKLAKLSADITRQEAELTSTREMLHKLEQTVPIAQQRARDYKDLVDKQFVSKHGYLDKEQERIEKEGDLATQRSRIKELQAGLLSAQAQKSALQSETQRLNFDSASEGLQKAESLEQELLKADSRHQQNTLTAPVDGTVQQLVIHTVGGVVTEAQPLMLIVPHDHPVEIEAFLENKDIGFVEPGQEAEVKVETFQYTKYGTLRAKVMSVSHDAINDEKRGLIYATRVKMEQGKDKGEAPSENSPENKNNDGITISVDGKQVNLSPGMAVSVEIKTGKRRVIEYFLSPFQQYQHESLRER